MAERLVVYYPYWDERVVQIQHLPLHKVTHINYAFAGIEKGQIAYADPYHDIEKPFQTPNGGRGRGNFGQLAYVKQLHPNIKILISIGGWGFARQFSQAVSTPANRKRFILSIDKFLRQWPFFDGVDIDWEYPNRPGDKRNFTLMLQDLRRILPRPHLLSVALGAGRARLKDLELPRVAELVDWATMMTYDYANIALGTTSHNTPLFPDPHARFRASAAVNNVSVTMLDAIKAGFPPQKLNMGLAFYAYLWFRCRNLNFGEYQPSYQRSGNPRQAAYAKLLTRMGEGGLERHFNTAAKVPFLWDPKTQTFISYDDAESLVAKADWAKEHRLGGLAIWTISQDAPGFPLLRAVESRW